jgi:hypothetical protein
MYGTQNIDTSTQMHSHVSFVVEQVVDSPVRSYSVRVSYWIEGDSIEILFFLSGGEDEV